MSVGHDVLVERGGTITSNETIKTALVKKGDTPGGWHPVGSFMSVHSEGSEGEGQGVGKG